MKLGISGAQSVGKTTLLNALRSEKGLLGFTICDEVTRRVKGYGLPINEDGNDATQNLIMQEHIVNVFMYENIITDRTALDGLVYTSYLHRRGKVSVDTLIKTRNIFNKVWPKYDYVFYIEPEFDLIDDGIRSADIKFRDEIADLFEMVIDKEKLTVTRIKGSVRDRVTTIINILEGR